MYNDSNDINDVPDYNSKDELLETFVQYMLKVNNKKFIVFITCWVKLMIFMRVINLETDNWDAAIDKIFETEVELDD